MLEHILKYNVELIRPYKLEVKMRLSLEKKILSMLVAPLLSIHPASASDSYSGMITGVQLVDTGSMQLRISLNTTMANCNLNFAFVEPSSSIFNAYYAEFVTAYSLGKTVSIQVNREASGFCRIFLADF